MGRTERESAQVLIDYFKLPITVDDYVEATEIGYVQHFPEAKLLPGKYTVCVCACARCLML